MPDDRPVSPRLPRFVGLCPSEHVGEFYMPLDTAERAICPECDQVLTIYTPTFAPEAALSAARPSSPTPEEEEETCPACLGRKSCEPGGPRCCICAGTGRCTPTEARTASRAYQPPSAYKPDATTKEGR